MSRRVRSLLPVLPLVAVAALVAGCGGGDDEPAAKGEPLRGTFKLTPGTCTADAAKGSYFRMITAGGTVEKGGYFANPDSSCPDQSFSVQAPGTDGGLVSGDYQPGKGKAFDAKGNARAGQITVPGSFTAIDFAVSTNEKDPQTGEKVAAPQVYVDEDGRISGQISAWSAAWNNLYFNQGAPKPDGSTPGITTDGITGTYDEKTRHFEIEWVSSIVGGPFDRFSGYWHLEGTFEPAG